MQKHLISLCLKGIRIDFALYENSSRFFRTETISLLTHHSCDKLLKVWKELFRRDESDVTSVVSPTASNDCCIAMVLTLNDSPIHSRLHE